MCSFLRSTVLAASLLVPARAARAQAPDSLVLRLAAMSAVTGLEDAMAESLLAALPGSALDRAGNVVLVRGSGEPVRAVLCPMDELGYVVGGITPDGYLTVRRVGTTNPGPLYDQYLEGQRVTVFGRRGAVPGVVGVRSTHLTRGRATGADDPFALDNAYVDVGATAAAGVAALGIEVLAPVTRAKAPHRYGEGGRLVAGVAVAARAACAALLSAARRANPANGTTIVAFVQRRHFALDGASHLLMERAPGAAPEAVVLLGEAARGTPGSAPAVTSGNIPVSSGLEAVTVWALPTRYARTPVETVSLADVAALEERLVAFLGGAR